MTVKKVHFTQLNSADGEYLEKVEPFIDEKLTDGSKGFLEGTSPGVGCTVTFGELKEASGTSRDPNPIVLGQLRRQYERAGWTVSIASDGPDGGHIKFE